MKPAKKKETAPESDKRETETFYRLKRISKFEYACEAVEVPITVVRTEPLKRNLRGIVLSRMFDLLEK